MLLDTQFCVKENEISQDSSTAKEGLTYHHRAALVLCLLTTFCKGEERYCFQIRLILLKPYIFLQFQLTGVIPRSFLEEQNKAAMLKSWYKTYFFHNN